MKTTAILTLSLLIGGSLGAAESSPTTILRAIDNGGGTQTGSAIQINASIGGLGGTTTAAGTQITLKQGVAGQIYDVSTLLLAAGTTNLNEGSFTRITVGANLDDDSILFLSPTDLQWTVIHGPNALIGPTGLLTAGPVAVDTPLAVEGAFHNRTSRLDVLVRESIPDNFTTAPYDFAGDGVPDDWQVQFFTPGDARASLSADSDGDGLVNLVEFALNLDPTAPSSGPLPRINSDGGSQEYLMLSYTRRAELPLAAAFHVDAASELSSATQWSAGPALISSTGPDENGLITDVWRDAEPVSESPHRFLRLTLRIGDDD